MKKLNVSSFINIDSCFRYSRLTAVCHKKCIAPKYREADLQKGEAVCIDRCVAKYMEIHERVGKKLTEISMQDQEFQARMAGAAGATL